MPLASRLLRADDTRKFTIGAARGADAPVNPAYLPAAPEGAGHVLVEPLPGGFALNLAPAMVAHLLTPVQALPLRPDFGRAEAPLVLPADSCLRVSCGEVEFDSVRGGAGGGRVRAPTFAAVLRETGRYQLGVALVFAALLLIVRAVPEDARALAGDDLQRLRRLDSFVTIPLDINSPEIDSAMASKTPGGGGAQAAKGTEGKAGIGRRSRARAAGRSPARWHAQGCAGGGGRGAEEPDARRSRRRDDRARQPRCSRISRRSARGGNVARCDGGADDRERLRYSAVSAASAPARAAGERASTRTARWTAHAREIRLGCRAGAGPRLRDRVWEGSGRHKTITPDVF